MIRLGNFNVVIDTCVLYDSHMRDILLSLAEKELYQPIWSELICEELKKNIIKKGNIPEDKAIKLVKVINQAFPEAMTISNKGILNLNDTNIDEKDRHVVTTAICSNAQVIVTYNIKDFPNETLKRFSIEAQTPDIFLTNILDLSFKTVLLVYEELEKKYKNPPISRTELLNRFKTKAPTFTSIISPYLDGSITRIY